VSAARYAVYFAPAVDSPWWRFGTGWLGWDEKHGQALAQPGLSGFGAEQFHVLTGEPRRYGFHATLKAPFRLREGVDETLLRHRFEALARELRALPLGALQPGMLDDFVALQPQPRQPAVAALAAKCVLVLDDLRAPLTNDEILRRHPERLPLQARELLQRFGYPWVLGLFRFHMTLSGPVDPATGELLVERAARAVDALNAQHPPMLDRLCLFREDHPGAPFLRVHEEVLAA
jgi:putative phosphonate metabolism protein